MFERSMTSYGRGSTAGKIRTVYRPDVAFGECGVGTRAALNLKHEKNPLAAAQAMWLQHTPSDHSMRYAWNICQARKRMKLRSCSPTDYLDRTLFKC